MEEDRAYLAQELEVKLADSILFWNEQIANAKGKEEFMQVGTMAVRELDERAVAELGIGMGETCVVSGSAVWSETIMTTDDDIIDPYTPEIIPDVQGEYRRHNDDNVIAKTGYFGGFAIKKLNGEEQSRLWYVFQLDQYTYTPDDCCSDTRIHYMFVDPEASTITPASVFEEPFFDAMAEPPAEAGLAQVIELRRRSNMFAKMIKSTAFRRLSHPKQIHAVDTHIQDAEAVTDIREMEVMLTAVYGYAMLPARKDNPEDEERLEYKVVNLSELLLRGATLALSMSGREHLTTKAIRNDGDVFNKYEGLCLTLELDENSILFEEREVRPKDIIHVPLSGQTIAIGFL
ncbi:MAG: hypothetical protein JWO35_349 [Candidatus Saccharibacteria bacterium]|nr:hypothetical protein [Candidatus Saccharibacteria bacterium]